jgi:hypothetical protein
VVARTLAKDPVERPTAHELLDLLLDLDPDEKTEPIRPELLQAAAAAQRTRDPAGPPPRRIRRMVLAGVAVLALGVTGLVAAQTLPRLGVASNVLADNPSGTAGAGPAGPTPPPAPSPSPSRSWTAGGPAVIDRLDRPGQWRDTRNDAEGRCVFADGRLEARTGMAAVYRCAGPPDSFAGNQMIGVDAAVLTPGSCAAIWFRAAGANAYLVSLCETEVRLGEDTEDGVADEVQAAVAGTGLGRVRRVEVVVQDGNAAVTVDGAELLNARLGRPSLATGRVTFGVIDDIISGDARAAFARAEVRQL